MGGVALNDTLTSALRGVEECVVWRTEGGGLGMYFTVGVMGHGVPATAAPIAMQSLGLIPAMMPPAPRGELPSRTHQPYFAGGSRSGRIVTRISGAATGLSRDAASGYTVAENATRWPSKLSSLASYS